eukprot:375270-Pelagomonas_calceolata.AAC.10
MQDSDFVHILYITYTLELPLQACAHQQDHVAATTDQGTTNLRVPCWPSWPISAAPLAADLCAPHRTPV